MKRKIIAAIAVVAIVVPLLVPMAAMASGGANYKHIESANPYNIDALTGATLTVEGPGVAATTPIAVRELEGAAASITTAVYTNGAGKTYTYEGAEVLAIIDGAINTNVIKADEQVTVVFKNRWRQDIASITYADLKAAKAAGKSVLLAHGVSDGKNTAPFVFDMATGLVPSLDNADGPIRLVYDPSVFKDSGTNAALGTGAFLSCAYMYVQTGAGEPGFKHSSASDKAYDNPANTEFLITLTGSALGREVNYTVAELEAMVEYDAAGNPKAGGLGWRDSYSLSNTTYWYVNQYEGIDLWQLLTQKLGISASKYANDKDTLVSFAAWDNYRTFTQFSMYQLAHPELSYFYEKSPLDIGTSRPTKAQLATEEYQPTNSGSDTGDWKRDLNGYPVKTGYPVLLAYGVNGYPYVPDADTPGYYGGLGNDGGPMKVIFGKTDGMNRASPSAEENYAYFFNNGSNQLQKAQEIYVGDGARYSTHSQNPGYKSMAGTPDALTVEIISTTGAKTTKSYTLAELENVLYGASKRDMDTQGRQEKAYYPNASANGKISDDLFEGVNLWYLLSEDIGMAGYLGTVEMYSEGSAAPAAKYSLTDIRAAGYNSARGTSGLGPMVAFAKNGYPLVKDTGAAGYIAADGVTGKAVSNSGGPLMFIRAQTESERASGTVAADGDSKAAVMNLRRIVINLEADPYSHNEEDGKAEISFTGAITNASGTTLTVSALETMQKYMVTGTYTIDGAPSEYRGLDLFKLINDPLIGASASMEAIIVSNGNGQEKRLTAADLQDPSKRIILAYGITSRGSGAPLAASGSGPMRLVINGAAAKDCVTSVTKIEIVAAEGTGWTHSFGNFLQYAQQTISISGSNLSKTVTYTVEEIEAMENIVVKDSYQLGGAVFVEGVDLYKLLQTIGFADGLTSSEITVYAIDGYAVSLTATDVEKGVNGKPVLLAYAQGTTAANGLPLVPEDTDAGFDPNVGNAYGPLRLMVHDNSGWCNKWVTRIVAGAESESKPDVKGPGFVTYEAGAELPFAGTRSVVADGSGGFWVGSYGGGLSFVDSAGKVTVYNTESSPALQTDFVSAVAADDSGGVWFSQNASYTDLTQNRGLGYLKDGKITWYEKGGEIPDNYVQAIEIDDSGNVWIGSFGGLTKYDGKTWKTWTKADGFPAVSVSAIKADSKGGVWVGFYPDGEGTQDDPFYGGYIHMDAAGKIDFSRVYEGEYNDNMATSLLADVWVRGFAIDSGGLIWIVRSGSFANMPTSVGGRVDCISDMTEFGGGYRLYDTFTGNELLGSALKDKGEIRAVAADPISGVWFGTTTSGIAHRAALDGELAWFSTENSAWGSDNITLDNIYCLSFARGALYVGSAGGVAVDMDARVFRDVISHWAREYICEAMDAGIVSGYADERFGPDDPLTRGQFITMLHRLAFASKAVDSWYYDYDGQFSDVSSSAYYANAVGWAADNGIAKGVGSGSFAPDVEITRQDMAVMLFNYYELYVADAQRVNAPVVFSDAGDIAGYASQAVSAMQQYGVINGKTEASFAPLDNTTRAEAATVIVRILRNC